MKRELLGVLSLFLFSGLARAAQPDLSYMPQIERFFTALEAGKFDQAVDDLYAGNPWIKGKADDLARLKSSLKGWPSLFGELQGHERITEERVGERFVHLDYIVYFDRQPIRLYFEFYKKKDGWLTHVMGYKTDIDDWVQEKAKTKYLYFRQAD